MADLKFSVGKISRDAVDVGVCTDITVSYDGAPVEFRGGDYRYPLEIELGNQSLTITAECGAYSIADPLDGDKETLVLSQGKHSGGMTGTFSNMVLVSAEVASTQDGFVGTSFEWHKVGTT